MSTSAEDKPVRSTLVPGTPTACPQPFTKIGAQFSSVRPDPLALLALRRGNSYPIGFVTATALS